jgi:hypothetical protein
MSKARPIVLLILLIALLAPAIVCYCLVCPGHLGTKTVSLDKLTSDPRIGVDYMGSDTKHHHFFRRNCYSLFALGEWSVTDRFRVKKDGVVSRNEFPLTTDRTIWQHYYLASTNEVARFREDFVRATPISRTVDLSSKVQRDPD